ncbi:MAG: metallo-mystery pair system four-Cys motif protein [Spirulinaceae cyanobacterium SM2_1_0]|nr:metallo-mystery pair system four-Cys motif protein [Spirulinaceae cyanobacterium SM2_1_0]
MNKIISLCLATLSLTAVVSLVARQRLQASDTQPVTIQFQGVAGDTLFRCGESYPLGRESILTTPADFRFYVSEVELIDTAGNAMPMTLEQDGQWQYQNVALLDFEDKTGACANGTTETRDRVTGTVPVGDYVGLRFTLGIPFALNHADAALAPSPLNLTSMWWNWRGGYKFVRIDLETGKMAASPSATKSEGGQGSHGGGHSGHGNGHPTGGAGFLIHLGSTGCQAAAGSQQPTACSNPNRVTVTFADFDPAANVVIADLAALVRDNTLMTNAPNTPVGCMSSPNDGDCLGIMHNFGLTFGGQATPGQTFFRMGDRTP